MRRRRPDLGVPDRRLRAVAFDLFHTLVDPEEFRPREFHRAREIARRLGLPVAEFEAAWAARLPRRNTSSLPRVVDQVRELATELGSRSGNVDWEEIDDMLGRYCDAALRTPRPEVIRSLRELRRLGWTLGVVSNCDEREVRTWRASPLADLIDATAFSCETGRAKPVPEAYQALVPRWGGIPLPESVFVGDGGSEELVGARRVGFARVLFQAGFVATNGFRSEAENARIRAQADETVAGLPELLDRLTVVGGPGPRRAPS